MSNKYIKFGLLLFSVSMGFCSIITKAYVEEHVYYDVSFRGSSFAMGDYSYNCIHVENVAWFGIDATNIVVNFKIRSPNHSIEYPKHVIYIDYIGSKVSIKKDANNNPFPLSFDNKAYKPDVAIFSREPNVVINEPKADGSGSYDINVECSKLEARKCFEIHLLWFVAASHKNYSLNPIVTVNGDIKSSIDSRSFWEKYHIIPIILGCICMGSLGMGIGIESGETIANRENDKKLGEQRYAHNLELNRIRNEHHKELNRQYQIYQLRNITQTSSPKEAEDLIASLNELIKTAHQENEDVRPQGSETGQQKSQVPNGDNWDQGKITKLIKKLHRKPPGKERRSISEIVDKLNEEGVPPKTGSKWTCEMVKLYLSA